MQLFSALRGLQNSKLISRYIFVLQLSMERNLKALSILVSQLVRLFRDFGTNVVVYTCTDFILKDSFQW